MRYGISSPQWSIFLKWLKYIPTQNVIYRASEKWRYLLYVQNIFFFKSLTQLLKCIKVNIILKFHKFDYAHFQPDNLT